MPRINEENVEQVLTYQPPSSDQIERFGLLRQAFISCAITIMENVPEGRERSLALTKIQECRMWANAGIALEDLPP